MQKYLDVDTFGCTHFWMYTHFIPVTSPQIKHLVITPSATLLRYTATHSRYTATHSRYTATHSRYTATHSRYTATHSRYTATLLRYTATHSMLGHPLRSAPGPYTYNIFFATSITYQQKLFVFHFFSRSL